MSCRPEIMKFLRGRKEKKSEEPSSRSARDAARDGRLHSQLLVEPRLAAGLEVADDDPQLSNVLDEFLQVLFEVVEFFRHLVLKLLK